MPASDSDFESVQKRGDDDATGVIQPEFDALPEVIAGLLKADVENGVIRPEFDAVPEGSTLVESSDLQDNFVEPREPAELVLCIMLSAAFAGLARYCWEGLHASGNWKLLVSTEGFFITLSLLALLLGLRPYLSPSGLQVSGHGIKYRAPYWPQRKTVNWQQVKKLYISPDVIIVLYRPAGKTRGLIPMIIQTNYLSEKEKVAGSLVRFSPVQPIFLPHANWFTRALFYGLYIGLIIWILWIIHG